MIKASGEFEVVSEPELNILTYRYVPAAAWAVFERGTVAQRAAANDILSALTESIQKTQRARGQTFVSRTRLETAAYGGKLLTVLRVVLANPLTTRQILADILAEQKGYAETALAQEGFGAELAVLAAALPPAPAADPGDPEDKVPKRVFPQFPDLTTLMVDNYDSFTFNLVQYLQELGIRVVTRRNDERSAAALLAERPDFFVLSPGPSSPDKAGVCLELIAAAAAADLPLLGVCLGHQAIGQAFGGRVVRAVLPLHGKVSAVTHSGRGVFAGLPSPLTATRYHSLVVEPASLPAALEVTAATADGIIMGLRHRERLIEGVQFHPESVLTEHGHAMLANFAAAVVARRATICA
jgi:anthranilate synthase component 2